MYFVWVLKRSLSVVWIVDELAAQLQIAGIIVERDSISRIEIGTRFVADYELRELARILKVSVNWLLEIE